MKKKWNLLLGVLCAIAVFVVVLVVNRRLPATGQESASGERHAPTPMQKNNPTHLERAKGPQVEEVARSTKSPSAALKIGPVDPQFASDPVTEKAKNAARVRTVERMYASMFQEFGWNRDAIQRFNEIELHRLTTADGYIGRMMANGDRPDRDTTAVIFDSVRAQADAELKAAFGADGFERIQAFDHDRPARAVVNEAAVALLYGSEPLTPTQARELVAVIAANATDPATGKVNITLANDTAIFRALSGRLTEAQIQVLQRVLDQRRADPGPIGLTKATSP